MAVAPAAALRAQAPLDLSPQEKQWLAENDGRIGLAASLAWPPFDFVAEDERRGLAIDYLTLLAARLGLQPSFRQDATLPSIEILPLLARSRPPADAQRVEQPFLVLRPSLLVRRSDKGIRGLADLRGKEVGTELVPVWRSLERDHPTVKAMPMEDTKRGLIQLSFGEVDALITLLPAATWVMESEGITNLRHVTSLDPRVELAFAVRPAGSPLASILAKAIGSLGEADHAAIQRRWIGIGGRPYWPFLLGAIGVLGLLLTGVVVWNRSLARRVAARTEALQHELAERTRVETALRESEELHRESLVEISDAVFLADQDGRVRYMSPDVAQRIGVASETVAGIERIEDVLGAEVVDMVRAHGSVKDLRIVVPGHDGCDRVLRVNGKATHVFGSSLLFACHDVTEEERATADVEAQRQAADQAHRMAALGALVSTLAHELNNPNHTIMLNVPVLRSAWQDALAILDQHARTHAGFRLANIPYTDMREDVLRLVDEIHQGADRIRRIVAGLRGYARSHAEQDGQLVDLETLLRAAVARVRPVLDAATERFDLVIDGPLAAVHAHPVLLGQVFVDLLGHAARAVAKKTQAIALRARVDGGCVLVEVHDEGPAVPEAQIVNVTKPFQKGGGSLEVAMAAWIVRQSGGALRISSEEGSGTLVQVELPAAGRGGPEA